MSKHYDLVVIGAGTAARAATTRVRAADKSVAIVDFRPYGGTCALRGCDPKKMLIGAAEALDHARRMQGKGIVGQVNIEWSDLMGFKRNFTDPVPEKQEQNYSKKGIDTYHGTARFTGLNTLDIDGHALEAKHILIAAGAEPIKLGIPGEEYLMTNEDFLVQESLPKKIVLVGGGYIASEFAHIAALAGAEVTILQRGERMLTQFDPDLVGWLMESFQSQGINVRTQTNVESVEKIGNGFQVFASEGDSRVEFEADWVVHAAGRAPALEALNLTAAEVTVEDGRLKLNMRRAGLGRARLPKPSMALRCWLMRSRTECSAPTFWDRTWTK